VTNSAPAKALRKAMPDATDPSSSNLFEWQA
jgi:hypothetical protein